MFDETRPNLIGARIQRVEDPRLLTGHGCYVDDINLPSTLHLAFLRSDQSHARILSLDTSKAICLPGVIDAVTGADITNDLSPIRASSRMRTYQSSELPPLAKDIVRYVGEPIVAILAENRYVAEDAIDLIAVQYQPLEPLTDSIRALETTAPLLHGDSSSNLLVKREFIRGDVDDALENASVRVKGRFRMGRKAPAPIENRCYLANYNRGKRKLDLYSSTQVPGIIRDALAEIMHIPGNRLRVIAPDVGGGFGSKASLYQEEVLVCVLSKKYGRPVKWNSDRREDLMSTSQAFDEIVEAELGLNTIGEILGLKAEIFGDIGAYSVYPWTGALEPVQVASFLPGPYRVPNYKGTVRAAYTCKPPTGPYRGVGRPMAALAMERLIDMAARDLGIDPRTVRQRNLLREDEFPYKAASGLVWDKAAFLECLEQACEKIEYEKLRSEQAKGRAEGRWIGVGLASYAELTGIGSRISAAPGMPINTGTETASIRLDSTGTVTAGFGVASHGQSLETTLAQIIAEELGADFEDVEIIQGDSSAMAHGTGTYASRSAILAGGAAILTAQALKKEIITAASYIMEASADDLSISESNISVIGTDRHLTFSELARAIYSEMGRLPKEIRENIQLDITRVYDPFFGTTAPATHAAVVEIDPETYAVTIQKYVVVGDSGRIINPLIADGQVHGGVAQGIGAALFEEIIHDETGQLLTANFVDYVIPSSAEIPSIDVMHLQTETDSNIGGFRGLGEGGTIGAPAAIANAISDALSPFSVDIDQLPITPQRLFQILNDKKNVV